MELVDAIKKAHEEICGLSGIYADLHTAEKMAEDTIKDAQWHRAIDIKKKISDATAKMDKFTMELVVWMNEQKKGRK
jgi:flavin-binding protein dodecin